jgi:hypothetical protein
MDVSSRHPKTINHFGASEPFVVRVSTTPASLGAETARYFLRRSRSLNDIAQMDADTELDAPLGRQSGIAARPMPYVKRNKNDAADAEAMCEAVRRPAMRSIAAC